MQDNIGIINIDAGRHGSTAPVKPFLDGLLQSNIAVTETTSDTEPDELNFEAVIDLTLTLLENGQTYTLSSFRVSQGHSDLDNNWWIGHSSFDCHFTYGYFDDDGNGPIQSKCNTSQDLTIKSIRGSVDGFSFGLN